MATTPTNLDYVLKIGADASALKNELRTIRRMVRELDAALATLGTGTAATVRQVQQAQRRAQQAAQQPPPPPHAVARGVMQRVGSPPARARGGQAGATQAAAAMGLGPVNFQQLAQAIQSLQGPLQQYHRLVAQIGKTERQTSTVIAGHMRRYENLAKRVSAYALQIQQAYAQLDKTSKTALKLSTQLPKTFANFKINARFQKDLDKFSTRLDVILKKETAITDQWKERVVHAKELLQVLQQIHPIAQQLKAPTLISTGKAGQLAQIQTRAQAKMAVQQHWAQQQIQVQQARGQISQALLAQRQQIQQQRDIARLEAARLAAQSRVQAAQISAQSRLQIAQQRLQAQQQRRAQLEAEASPFNLRNIASRLPKITTWMGAVWGLFGMISAVQFAFNTLMDFEDRMIELRKVMNEAVTDFDALADAAFRLGREFGRSAVEVADAMAEIGKQGKNQAEVIELTRVALLAANIAEMDAVDAVRLLSATMAQYSMDTSDAIRVLDAWNELSNRTRAETKDMAEALSRTGEVGKQLGLSFDQLNAIVATLVEVTGRAGGEIGNTLKFAFTHTYIPAAVRQLEQFGIAVYKQDGSLRSLWNVLNDVAAAWDQYDTAQRQAIAMAIGGTRHANQMMALFSNWGLVMRNLNISINSTGSAMRENEKFMESTRRKAQQLRASFEELVQVLGETGLLDVMKSAIDFARFLISAFNDIDESVRKTVIGVGLLTSAFLLLNRVMRETFGVALFAGGLSGIVQSVKTWAAGIAQAARSAGTLSAAITGIGMAARGLGAVLRTFGTIGGYITAAIVAIKLFEAAMKRLGRLFESNEDRARRELEAIERRIQAYNDEIAVLDDYRNKLLMIEQSTMSENEKQEKKLRLLNELQAMFPHLVRGETNLESAINKVSSALEGQVNQLNKLSEAHRNVLRQSTQRLLEQAIRRQAELTNLLERLSLARDAGRFSFDTLGTVFRVQGAFAGISTALQYLLAWASGELREFDEKVVNELIKAVRQDIVETIAEIEQLRSELEGLSGRRPGEADTGEDSRWFSGIRDIMAEVEDTLRQLDEAAYRHELTMAQLDATYRMTADSLDALGARYDAYLGRYKELGSELQTLIRLERDLMDQIAKHENLRQKQEAIILPGEEEGIEIEQTSNQVQELESALENVRRRINDIRLEIVRTEGSIQQLRFDYLIAQLDDLNRAFEDAQYQLETMRARFDLASALGLDRERMTAAAQAVFGAYDQLAREAQYRYQVLSQTVDELRQRLEQARLEGDVADISLYTAMLEESTKRLREAFREILQIQTNFVQNYREFTRTAAQEALREPLQQVEEAMRRFDRAAYQHSVTMAELDVVYGRSSDSVQSLQAMYNAQVSRYRQLRDELDSLIQAQELLTSVIEGQISSFSTLVITIDGQRYEIDATTDVLEDARSAFEQLNDRIDSTVLELFQLVSAINETRFDYVISQLNELNQAFSETQAKLESMRQLFELRAELGATPDALFAYAQEVLSAYNELLDDAIERHATFAATVDALNRRLEEARLGGDIAEQTRLERLIKQVSREAQNAYRDVLQVAMLLTDARRQLASVIEEGIYQDLARGFIGLSDAISKLEDVRQINRDLEIDYDRLGSAIEEAFARGVISVDAYLDSLRRLETERVFERQLELVQNINRELREGTRSAFEELFTGIFMRRENVFENFRESIREMRARAYSQILTQFMTQPGGYLSNIIDFEVRGIAELLGIKPKTAERPPEEKLLDVVEGRAVNLLEKIQADIATLVELARQDRTFVAPRPRGRIEVGGDVEGVAEQVIRILDGVDSIQIDSQDVVVEPEQVSVQTPSVEIEADSIEIFGLRDNTRYRLSPGPIDWPEIPPPPPPPVAPQREFALQPSPIVPHLAPAPGETWLDRLYQMGYRPFPVPPPVEIPVVPLLSPNWQTELQNQLDAATLSAEVLLKPQVMPITEPIEIPAKAHVIDVQAPTITIDAKVNISAAEAQETASDLAKMLQDAVAQVEPFMRDATIPEIPESSAAWGPTISSIHRAGVNEQEVARWFNAATPEQRENLRNLLIRTGQLTEKEFGERILPLIRSADPSLQSYDAGQIRRHLEYLSKLLNDPIGYVATQSAVNVGLLLALGRVLMELSSRKGLGGFSSGGFTGFGGKYDVAGVVHAGEYVIPKWMVDKYPEVVAMLEDIRLRGYAEGGLLGPRTPLTPGDSFDTAVQRLINSLDQLSETIQNNNSALNQYIDYAKAIIPAAFAEYSYSRSGLAAGVAAFYGYQQKRGAVQPGQEAYYHAAISGARALGAMLDKNPETNPLWDDIMSSAGTIIGQIFGGPAGALLGNALGGLIGSLIDAIAPRGEKAEEPQDLIVRNLIIQEGPYFPYHERYYFSGYHATLLEQMGIPTTQSVGSNMINVTVNMSGSIYGQLSEADVRRIGRQIGEEVAVELEQRYGRDRNRGIWRR